MPATEADRTPATRAPARTHPDPPAVFAAALGAMVGLAVALPGPDAVAAGWRWTGLALVAGGAVLHRAAWRRFRAQNTTVRSDRAPRTLVTAGPFSRTRNPMYLAGVLILLGTAVLLGATTPFLVVPVYAWIVDRRFLPVEEEVLERRFGDAYRTYRAEVRRWL